MKVAIGGRHGGVEQSGCAPGPDSDGSPSYLKRGCEREEAVHAWKDVMGLCEIRKVV